MRKINVSEGRANYSQRNNEILPFESCNVTSMVMALDYLDWELPVTSRYPQPEDRLRFFIENDPGCLMERKEFLAVPGNMWAANIPSVQIHDLLASGTNRWLGKQAVQFGWARSIKDILAQLEDGRPVVMSGDFPGYPIQLKKPLGHIVTLVGAVWENDTDSIPSHVIIDDPYGNTMDNWKGSGNDIEIPWAFFLDWFKAASNKAAKWGHFFRRANEC